MGFLRKYSLEIILPTGQTKLFTNLQIEFQIVKAADSEANSMTLSIFNVNNNTKELLKRNKDTVIILKASYRGGTWNDENNDDPLELLFHGTIINTQTARQGPNVITTILSKDGNVPMREARASSQWPEGVTLRQIVNDLVNKHFIEVTVNDAIPISRGEVKGIKDSGGSDSLEVKFQNGFSARGPVKKILDNILDKNKLQWSITDGVFNIFPKDSTLNEKKLIINGILGTPEISFQEPDQLTNATDNPSPDGVGFRVLMSPKIKPGKQVEFNSINVSGDFKIEKVTHKGSYFSNSWETSAQAIRVNK